jgi:SEC-C motif-containing protein
MTFKTDGAEMQCPCGSGLEFSACCEPYIKGEKQPHTAEALMRSRYCAYVDGDVTYIKKTLAPESRHDFDPVSTKEWASKSKWLGLQVLSTEKGTPGDRIGTVEFVAKYSIGAKTLEHHEVAQFRKEPSDGLWYFVDGEAHTHEDGKGHNHGVSHAPVVREAPKVGRNDPCTCGSGQKYKKCCGAGA